MSILASVPLAPRDPILGLTEQFAADPRPGKVRISEQPRRHYVVERLALDDGVHVSLRELRTDDQAHLPTVREEMGGALCRVLKLGR